MKKFGHMHILVFPVSCDSKETEGPCALVLESESQLWVYRESELWS